MSILLQSFDINLDIDNYNDDFLILKSANTSTLRTLGKAIFQAQFDFVEEVIVTEVEICLKLNDRFDETKIEWFKTLGQKEMQPPKTYPLPVYFSAHEDWATVETLTGLKKNEIIEQLITTDFSIAMFGFLPGFLYLDGLDESLHLPRKTTPSKYVKANSIAIGGKYVGLYAVDSPGGWYVIGQTPRSVLKMPAIQPIEFNIADKIKLYAISETEYNFLKKQP